MHNTADRTIYNQHYMLMKRIYELGSFREFRNAVENIYTFCSREKGLKSLLDVGCYSGSYHILYEKYFTQIELSDIADQRSNEVVGRFPFHQFSLDADRLPSAINEYDFINLIEVIEHVQNVNQALSNIRKLTRDGGYILLTTPNANRLAERIKKILGLQTKFPTAKQGNFLAIHYREFSLEQIISLLQEYGFKIIKTQFALFGIGSICIPCLNPALNKYKKNIILLAQKE